MLCLSGFELYSRWVPLGGRGFELETTENPASGFGGT